MEFEAFKVDAFTSQAYAGNPAGVVPEADGLTDAQMQAVAREMNVSETAFVLSSDDADLRLRYFTPTREVPLCGHATVAALHVLVETKRLVAPASLRVQTPVGALPLEVRAGPEVFLTSDPLEPSPSPWSLAEAAEALGCDDSALETGFPPLMWRKDLYVAFRDLAGVRALRPNHAHVEARCRSAGLDGIVAFALEAEAPDSLTHLRYFAPVFGIPEDPVTGVAHMGLAHHLVHRGRLDVPGRFTGEQGAEVGRPGQVSVEVEGTRDAPVVRVGGRAVTTLAGRMRAP